MAMRAVCLASAVSWPRALLRRSSAILEGNDSRPTCMMPVESCSRLSRRFTTFLSSASVLHAASDFFETFVMRAPGHARRAGYNKGLFLYATCLPNNAHPSLTPRPRREHRSSQEINQLLTSAGCPTGAARAATTTTAASANHPPPVAATPARDFDCRTTCPGPGPPNQIKPT